MTSGSQAFLRTNFLSICATTAFLRRYLTGLDHSTSLLFSHSKNQRLNAWLSSYTKSMPEAASPAHRLLRRFWCLVQISVATRDTSFNRVNTRFVADIQKAFGVLPAIPASSIRAKKRRIGYGNSPSHRLKHQQCWTVWTSTTSMLFHFSSPKNP